WHPTPAATSQWASGSTMRGQASSALMARAAEQTIGPASGLRPARWTADLSRPVPMRPSTVQATVLRSGRRLRSVDVELIQEGSVMARARALFLAVDNDVAGQNWETTHSLALPPPDMTPDTPEPRLYYSEAENWSTRAAPHRNNSRKQMWTFPFSVVEHERATPFQFAAGAADLASPVSFWEAAGISYINADITLALARLPGAGGIGVAAAGRVASSGIAVGTVLMHDREGIFGTATVSAIWSGDRRVDPGDRDERSRGVG
ncbi:MAG TPA: acyl-CoA thioesterase domain-containing protein, partial [Nocardioidaceae bacterium]